MFASNLLTRTCLSRPYVTYGQITMPRKESWESDTPRTDELTITRRSHTLDGRCARCGEEAIKGSGKCLERNNIPNSTYSTDVDPTKNAYYLGDRAASQFIMDIERVFLTKCLAREGASNEEKN